MKFWNASIYPNRYHFLLSASKFIFDLQSSNSVDHLIPLTPLPHLHSQGSNKRNAALLSLINGGGKIHIVPSNIRGLYFLRFAVCALLAEPADVEFAWTEVRHQAAQLVAREVNGHEPNPQNGAHEEA